MLGMTRKQFQLLDFITDYMNANNGVAPNYDEMKSAMGLRSKSGIHRLLTALEQRGYIRRIPACARAIEVRLHPQKSIAVHPTLWSALSEYATARGVSVDVAAAEILKTNLSFRPAA